jgi:tetratricopeptide (TPR) repeat protein
VPTEASSSVQQPDRERGWKELGGVALVGLLTAVAIVTSAALPLAAEVAHRTSVERARMGDWRGAAAAAERATRLWRVEPEHHRLLGRTHLERALAPGGEPAALEAAERSLLAARDRRPLDYASWATLGRFYFRTGVAVDAGALQWAHPAYHRAIALAPHFARLHVAWGEVFVAEERPELAFERFERALALDATDAVAARWLGEVALALGLPETAVVAYEQAARYDPGTMASHLGLARAYLTLGEEELANAALGRARHLEPGHPAVEVLAREIANGLERDGGETSDDH